MAAVPEDERFMAEAIRLSLSHLGQTSTNPSVGCVIVRDGDIVGRGVTAPGGRPHAETQAIADAGEKARGATAYVSLEPCSHHGQTPPCANALVEAGLSRVVVALTDPDDRVSGRGLRILRDAGIAVETGVLARQASRALAGYLMRKIRHRPQVILKLAVSRDGKIGRLGAGQVAITGPAAREAVHHLRTETDAILVGIGTAIADDPDLTVRLPGLEARSPIRIVLDRRLELPLTSRLARTAASVPVIAVCGLEAAGSERHAALAAAGVEVLPCPDLGLLLEELARRGMSTLLVEGGANVARQFLEAGLIDRIDLYQGDVEIGADGIESPLDAANIPSGFDCVLTERFGADLLRRYEREL